MTTLVRKHEKAEAELQVVAEYLTSIETSITTKREGGDALLREWREHEAQWKKKVVDINQHHIIDSDYPYEPPAEAGVSSFTISACSSLT